MDLRWPGGTRFSVAMGLLGSIAVHAIVAFGLIVGFSSAERAISRVSSENRENLEFSVMKARGEPALRAEMPRRAQTARPVVASEGAADAEVASRPSAVAVSEGGGTAAPGERERYLSELAATLNQRLVYPRASQRLRESGRVVVRIFVKRDGTLAASEILAKSAFARLDEAALKLARDTATFRPIPPSILRPGEEDGLTVDVPIDYVLAN